MFKNSFETKKNYYSAFFRDSNSLFLNCVVFFDPKTSFNEVQTAVWRATGINNHIPDSYFCMTIRKNKFVDAQTIEGNTFDKILIFYSYNNLDKKFS